MKSEGNIFIIWNLRSPTVSLAMMRNIEFQDPYLAGNIPAEIAENWKEFFPENEDFSCEEVLVQQVILKYGLSFSLIRSRNVILL